MNKLVTSSCYDFGLFTLYKSTLHICVGSGKFSTRMIRACGFLSRHPPVQWVASSHPRDLLHYNLSRRSYRADNLLSFAGTVQLQLLSVHHAQHPFSCRILTSTELTKKGIEKILRGT
jgi:hypothetical protein